MSSYYYPQYSKFLVNPPKHKSIHKLNAIIHKYNVTFYVLKSPIK